MFAFHSLEVHVMIAACGDHLMTFGTDAARGAYPLSPPSSQSQQSPLAFRQPTTNQEVAIMERIITIKRNLQMSIADCKTVICGAAGNLEQMTDDQIIKLVKAAQSANRSTVRNRPAGIIPTHTRRSWTSNSALIDPNMASQRRND